MVHSEDKPRGYLVDSVQTHTQDTTNNPKEFPGEEVLGTTGANQPW